MVTAQTAPPAYVISTFAGIGIGDGASAKQATLVHPQAVAFDSSGNLYIADTEQNRVRRVTPGGTITTYAGNGGGASTGDGGPATAAEIGAPAGLAVDRAGNLYISTRSRIRRVSPSGVITTIAGSTQGVSGDGQPAVNAHLYNPAGLVFDSSGSLYIADTGSVRKITPDGLITTVAGASGHSFPADGAPATSMPLFSVQSVAVDGSGNLYIGSLGAVYRVNPAGLIFRIAGKGNGGGGGYGGDGQAATSADMAIATGLALDGSGAVFFADGANHRIRKVSGGVITTAAGSGVAGYQGDGGPGTASQVANPRGLAIDRSGTLYIADQDNNRIRTLTPDGTIGAVAGGVTDIEGGPATTAALSLAGGYFGTEGGGLAIDGAGNLYVSEAGTHRVRKISTGGIVTTVAGTGASGFSGDGGPALAARLNFPSGVAVDARGNLYIADTLNFRVRVVSPDGIIRTVAGNGSVRPFLSNAPAGDDGPATSASFGTISSVATDSQGNLYIGDEEFGGARKVTPDGIITSMVSGYVFAPPPSSLAAGKSGSVFSGGGTRSAAGWPEGGYVLSISPSGTASVLIGGGGEPLGDGGPASRARIWDAMGLATDNAGSLIIADSPPLFGGTPPNDFTHRVRLVTPASTIYTIAGTGVPGFNGDGGLAASAQLAYPKGVAVDSAGNIYVADQVNQRIRKLTPDPKARLTAVSGDSQTGLTGSALQAPLVVQLTGGSGSGLPNTTVAFTVSSGTAALKNATVVTGPDGKASSSLTLGNTAGRVAIAAAVPGLPPVTFTATAVAPPAISGGGVILSSNFGGAAAIAPGAWLEIYGSNLSSTTRTWAGSDFISNQAPISLAEVKVAIGGKPAFVQLVSPSQINVQVPDGIAEGQASVVVTNANGSSAVAAVPVAARVPALLAPSAFRSGGRQYAAALFPDNATFVGTPGLAPGAVFRPARAGDHIVLYGIGFGAVTPPVAAGQITDGPNALPNILVKFGGIAAKVEYAGLTVGAVGLYQLNLVVPEGVTGDAPISITVDGIPVKQTLYLTVQ